MSLNLATLLRESAKKHPTKPAIHINDVTLPYAMLDGMAQRFAGALRNLGVRPGQHVALLLPNVPQFTIAYYGCHYNANPVVPLNVLLTGDEVAYHLADSDAVAVVAWEGFYDAAKAGFDRVDGCKHLIVAKLDRADMTAPAGAHNLTAITMAAQPVGDIPATSPDDTAVLLYTSGTTGKSKGAELSHFNLFYNAQWLTQQPLPVPLGDATVMVVLPLFHSFGQTVMQNSTLCAGGTLVLVPRFEPLAAAQLIEKHKVNVFAGVPTMYFALLNHPEVTPAMTETLGFCLSGGAAMPVEVMKAFDEKHKQDILEGYGLSETSPVASFNPPGGGKKAGSIGVPIWGVEFRLVDGAGKVITETDTPGEICIKGHNVMKGYYKRPDATKEAIVDGWFHSGDIGTRDKDGYYYIVDRKKDMIIRGGFNVYPRELEEVLYAHPAVAEAAVVGVPHESHGEEVKAVLALKPGQSATAEEIIAYCKERLAAYKYPRIVEFREALPKGPTGKILKRELR
ncbi:MAG: long-chain fatty acid--CoA ligase [Kofleriaceae bacterium]|nr:MAG: long-chain fatty acid--CoA ligase [Kofleriaceae bacterium]MBZ0234271.1 long-chain fatty acid--CoA ligase [Kofleriaceae bacterium]